MLATRLRPPALRHREVDRARLLELLDTAKDHSLTILSAPTGFGKTTLLAQWCKRATAAGATVAWVTLDEMDTETKRVLSYIVAALERTVPGLADRFDSDFAAEIDLRPASAVARVVNEIDRLDNDVYLILDDIHLVDDAETLSLLETLMRASLSNLHLVFSGREIPDLPLARHRMHRELLEIGHLDLQFQGTEARAFFDAQDGVALDDAHIDKLNTETDGWVAGLQLAALSIRNHPDADAFIDSFSGRQKDIGQLLTDEVISKQSPEIVDFLERSSVLSTLSPTVCDHLCGRDDSARILADLESANFFIFPVDDRGEYFRMHRLLRDYLSQSVERRDPALKTELHRQAAGWYRDNASPVRAADHALRASSHELAAEILDEFASELFETGRGTALLSLARKIPTDILAAYPRMQLKRSHACSLQWEFEDAHAALQNVRDAMASETVASAWRDRGIDGDKIYLELIHRDSQLALLADDIPRAGRLGREWLEAVGDKRKFEQAVSRTSLLLTDREQYRRPEIESAPAIRAMFQSDGRAWATVWHDSIVGTCALYDGNLDMARSLYRDALDTAMRVSGEGSSTAAMPALLLAEVLYERNELEEAGTLLERYLPISEETGLVDQLIAGYITAARISSLKAKGQLKPPTLILDAADAAAKLHQFERLRANIIAERMRLYLAAGDVGQAIRFAKAEDIAGGLERFEPGDGVTSTAEMLALSAAKLLLVRSRIPDAVGLLEKWRRFAKLRSATRSEVRIGVLLTKAYQLQGERRKAQRAIRAAMVAGQDGGFIRSFVDAGKPILDIIKPQRPSRSGSDDAFNDYRARILEAFGVASAAEPPADDADARRVTPAEMLSPRESEILVLVSRGLMNAQIADELGMSVGTVKWYMQQLFGKLDVRRRSQAVHRARQLGLIA
ncbi:MAG: LuxR C-terminal-related transcriptional regulator [Pseudomonadota bacterium]